MAFGGSKAGDYHIFVGNEDPEEAATLRACSCEQKDTGVLTYS